MVQLYLGMTDEDFDKTAFEDLDCKVPYVSRNQNLPTANHPFHIKEEHQAVLVGSECR